MWLHEVDFHLAYSSFLLGVDFVLILFVLFWRHK